MPPALQMCVASGGGARGRLLDLLVQRVALEVLQGKQGKELQ